MGYQSPDLTSKKSICFSGETSIIEGYKSKCILGCYYETMDLDIEYVRLVGAFVELKFKKEGKADVLFYVKKSDVRIDN